MSRTRTDCSSRHTAPSKASGGAGGAAAEHPEGWTEAPLREGRRGPRRNGYTAVELLMALSALAIGVSGVIAMQKVTVASNRNAKEMATATRVGEAWADQLTADGSTWSVDSNGTSTIGNTVWLSAYTAGGTTAWYVPTYSTVLNFGPGFNALGDVVNNTTNPGDVQFCVNLRLAELHSQTAPTGGNGVIRAQIRVFWPREDVANALLPAVLSDLCSLAPNTFNANLGALHVIYLSTAIRQTPKGLL